MRIATKIGMRVRGLQVGLVEGTQRFKRQIESEWRRLSKTSLLFSDAVEMFLPTQKEFAVYYCG